MSTAAVGTSPVWPNYSTLNQSLAPTTSSTTLGKDDFLKILMAQLSNQDPMKPMDDTQFIAQMAQFSAVEQTTNMANELAKLKDSLGLVSGLIGKTATYIDTNSSDGTTTDKSGVVSAITVKNGVQYAQINGNEISLDQLTSIGDTPSTTTSSGGSASTTPGN